MFCLAKSSSVLLHFMSLLFVLDLFFTIRQKLAFHKEVHLFIKGLRVRLVLLSYTFIHIIV
jgi:hypothetical protein